MPEPDPDRETPGPERPDPDPDDRQLEARLRSWRVRVFAATWLSYAAYYMGRKPFYVVKGELGWDAEVLGAIGAVYLLAYTVGQFLAAWAGGRWGPRVLLLTGMAVSAGVSVLFGFTDSPATFMALMAVNGLAQATGWCANVGSMAEWFPRKERGTVMGLWATNFQIGGVVSSALAALVAKELGFRWSFVAGAGVLMLVWGVVLAFQRNRPEDVGLPKVADEDDAGDDDPAGPVAWTRTVWTNVLLLGSFYFFIKFIRYAVWSWTPFLLKRFYGMETDDAGYLSTVFDVAGTVGVFALGFLSDRLFRGRRVGISFLFILGMAGACAMLYGPGRTSLVLFSVSMALIGFTLFGPDAILTSASAIEVGSRRSAARAAGIINGMGAIGSVVQELMIGRGLAGEEGMGYVFGLLILSSAGAAFFLAILMVRNRRGSADL